MPLSLEETKSLIAALGLKIAQTVLDQKAKSEQFTLRRGKIKTEANEKPDEWQFGKEFADALARADAAAGTHDFDAALKLLDEAEEILERPDAPPAPPPRDAPAKSQEQPQAGAPSLADLEALSKARGVYTTAVSKARQHAGLFNVIPKATAVNLLAQIQRAEEL